MRVTIVFRGLMVFHYMTDYMEIGVMDAPLHPGHPVHVPRIIKTKNGVISSIFDLRTRPELKSVGQPGRIREWELEVTNPLQPTATKFQQGPNFNRLHHPHPRDFRWITDLEGRDLHNRDLTADLDTSKLLMVLRVRHGEFYTAQLSKRLTRKRANPPVENIPFGIAAEVIGCDIAFDLGDLTLRAGNTRAFTFDESAEDGVIYEISNAPPDVPPDAPYPVGSGHFAMYYSHLFRTPLPNDEYKLIPEGDVTPSPDPALCGAVVLGQRG